MITGKQVVAARGLLGMSQSDLAEACDLTRVTISSFELDSHPAKPETINLIKRTLEARGIEFLNGRGVIIKKPGQDSPSGRESAGK